MNEGIHLDLDTWIVPGLLRLGNWVLGTWEPGQVPARSRTDTLQPPCPLQVLAC